MMDSIEAAIFNTEDKEISSTRIGEIVMEHLKDLDAVAYVRFASVYREFKDVSTSLDLGSAVLLPVLILLDHSQRYILHLFIGGESSAAGITKTAAANAINILYRSGINYSGIILITIWTSHRCSPSLL